MVSCPAMRPAFYVTIIVKGPGSNWRVHDTYHLSESDTSPDFARILAEEMPANGCRDLPIRHFINGFKNDCASTE
jgi:hypothetical protein